MNAIIQTCLLEKSYNKYYSKICQKLSYLSQDFTQNLYGALFEILLHSIKKMNGKKLIKLSKLMSDCLILGVIGAKLFKYLQVDNLNKPTLQLTKLILKQLFQRMAKEDLCELACKISKKGANFDTCDHLRNITVLIMNKEEEYCKKMRKQGQGKHILKRFSENGKGFKRWIKYKGESMGMGGEGGEDEEGGMMGY